MFGHSGPAAFCGFKHTSSLSMPQEDMLIYVRHFGVMVAISPADFAMALVVQVTLNLWGSLELVI